MSMVPLAAGITALASSQGAAASQGAPGKAPQGGNWKGGFGLKGGKGGKSFVEPVVQHDPSDVFAWFCKQRGVSPNITWSQIGMTWHCVIKVDGLLLEAKGENVAKIAAQKQAEADYVKQLTLQGLAPRMPSKRQLEKEMPKAKGPSWAIQGGAADIIVDAPNKKAKGKGKDKGKNQLKEETKGRDIINEYSDILTKVRASDVDGAIEVVRDRLQWDRGAMTVKQFATIVTNMGVRCNPGMASKLMQLIADMELVCFDDTASRNYMSRFARWAMREFLAEGDATIKMTEQTSVASLERNGTCVPQLTCTAGKNASEFNLSSSGPLPANNSLMRGDWLFLTFPHTARVGQHDGSNGKLPATLEAENIALLPVGQHGIVVKIVGVKPQLLQDIVGKFCRVDRAANHVTFNRQVEALRVLSTCTGEKTHQLGWLRQILMNADVPGAGGREAALCEQYHGGAGCPNRFDLLSSANPSQYEALKAGTSRRLTLIQGPPGCGKTSTALLLVQLWIAARRGPILCCADSNVAVDNLLDGCAKAGLDVIRVGRTEAIRADLEEYTLNEKAKAFGKGATDRGERNNWVIEKRLLENCEVVCCTCSGAAHPVMEGLKFQCLLIDEAGQATELAQIVPMLHLTGNGSIALVGDHKQLPPTVACLEADVEGLGTSLFERMASLGVPPVLLDTQYRMHPAIAAFPAREFYGGELRSGCSGTLRPPPKGIVWPQAHAGVAFLPIQCVEQKEGNSYINDAEAQIVEKILSAVIISGDLPPKDIGVITPYAAQAKLLRRRFGCPAPGRRREVGQTLTGHAAVEVSSVDGFQGREKELIIVSTVRANPKGNVGFLSDPRRLNVMLTRAKRGLLVIGHFETLAKDEVGWRPFLVWVQQRGFVAGCEPTLEPAAQEMEALSKLRGEDLLQWIPQVDDDDV